MVWFFISTLIISIVGLVSLILLKQWELSTGHVVLGRVRPKVGAAAHRLLSWFEYVLPGLFKEYVRRSYRMARTIAHRLAALGVVLAERALERSLGTIKDKTRVRRSDAEASQFLREVSEHKKQLLKRTKQRAIYEE